MSFSGPVDLFFCLAMICFLCILVIVSNSSVTIRNSCFMFVCPNILSIELRHYGCCLPYLEHLQRIERYNTYAII